MSQQHLSIFLPVTLQVMGFCAAPNIVTVSSARRTAASNLFNFIHLLSFSKVFERPFTTAYRGTRNKIRRRKGGLMRQRRRQTIVAPDDTISPASDRPGTVRDDLRRS